MNTSPDKVSSRPTPAPTLPRVAAFLLAALLLITPRAGHPESAPIFMDGTFGDWTGPVEHLDPAGDAGAGVDFRQIDVANDDNYLYIRFQTTVEVGIQESPTTIVLLIDTDMNASTGYHASGTGAELRWFFGSRYGCYYGSGSCATILPNAIRLQIAPSVTSNTFEIAIARDARPTGSTPLFPGSTIRIVLFDNTSGDYAPNYGGLTYTFDSTPVPPPGTIAFNRQASRDVRVVTWNVPNLASGSSFDPAVTPAADRVLSAIAPDIICLQEIYNPTAAQTRGLVESMLPESMPWYAARQNDCVVVSRYPVLQSWALDANLAVLLDTYTAFHSYLLLVCAHPPCCTNDASRQQEIDHIMSFFRDAMEPGGLINVAPGTAFMIAGDMNLVGYSQQLTTLLTGDIVDQATYGPDFYPDWDASPLADVISSHTGQRVAYTWRADATSYVPGRLDFLIYNDSVLNLEKHFVVYSPEMSPDELAVTGIQPADVTTVSDHLPHIADFRPVNDQSGIEEPRGGFGGLVLRPASCVGRNEIRFTLELGAESTVAIEVFDVQGRLIQSLPAAGSSFALGAGAHRLVWDGGTLRGDAAPGGVYYARVTARSGRDGNELMTVGRWVLVR